MLPLSKFLIARAFILLSPQDTQHALEPDGLPTCSEAPCSTPSDRAAWALESLMVMCSVTHKFGHAVQCSQNVAYLPAEITTNTTLQYRS